MFKSVFLTFVVLCTGVAFAGNVGSGEISGPRNIAEYGIFIAAKTFEAICWYEYLENYIPTTKSWDFNQCHGQGAFQRKQNLKQRANEKYFGIFLHKYAMDKLPKDYMLECSKFLLQDRHQAPSKDYSKVLGDREGSVESPYPYQAFTYCLVSVLHQRHKDISLHKLNERMTKDKNWAEAMFDRENEFRGLHTVKPLIINEELTKRAEKWANQLARDCQMYHIHSSHPDYRLNGSRMGENLFTGDGINNPKEDMALFGTNIWYEEIEYYPWPEYTGYGEDPFYKFAHFTQMIWKDTKYVGYGYAINASQSCGQYFIVARYFPPGNFYDSFKENILPLTTLPTQNIPEEIGESIKKLLPEGTKA